MIKPEQVPDEVVEAAAKELAHTNGWRNQQGVEVCKPVVIDIIAAALNAWPGIKLENLCGWVMDGPDLPYVEETASIILPLPQEGGDE